MRLSISNIAWDLEDEPTIAKLLRQSGLDRIDLAPGKYFPDPEAASLGDIEAVKQLWLDRGFAVEGMQALLFGTSGLNLFADDDDRMLDRLSEICRIGGGLGARTLTFGSPRNRDRSGLSDSETERIAVRFFRRLGDRAASHGVIVCLEPNPAIYHCNFLTTTVEAAAMVQLVDHPGIGLQLDTGAMALNCEDAGETIRAVAPLIRHVHASEPLLAPLGDGGAPHGAVARALRAARPDLTVTIEMVPKVADRASVVARAVAVAKAEYGESA